MHIHRNTNLGNKCIERDRKKCIEFIVILGENFFSLTNPNVFRYYLLCENKELKKTHNFFITQNETRDIYLF